MRRAVSIIFEVIAGFSFYAVFLFAFIGLPVKEEAVRPVVVTIFSIFAIAALLVGLAITRFQKWKRDIGIVLICAAGITALVIVMFASLSGSEEFRKTATSGAMTLIKGYHYVAGSAVMIIVAAFGFVLVIADWKKSKKLESE